jgi:hypothetical protein
MYLAQGVLPALLGDAHDVPTAAFLRRYRAYFEGDPPSFPAFLVQPQATSEPQKIFSTRSLPTESL